jgi:hypothetical protein
MSLYEDLSGSELLEACQIYYSYFCGYPIRTPERPAVRDFVKKLKNKYPSPLICPLSSSTLQITPQDEDMKNSYYPMSVNVLAM